MSNKSIKSELTKIAKLVRAELKADQQPRGRCYQWSKALVEALADEGISGVIVAGHYRIDSPDRQRLAGLAMFSGGDTQPTKPKHHWVSVGGYIIDITADQFNGEVAEADKQKGVVVVAEADLPQRYIH